MIDIISQAEELLKTLKEEKSSLEHKIRATEDFIKTLKGVDNNENTSLKPNQTEEAKEKMRIAQKARQEREKNYRFEKIKQYLTQKNRTTRQVAELLQLSDSTARKYLRECPYAAETRSNEWKIK